MNTVVDARMRSLIKDLIAEGRQSTPMNLNLIRATEDEKLAVAAGFALPPPIYALGTPVNSLGVSNFRDSRVNWEALPSAVKVAELGSALILDEERIDFNVDPTNLHMFAGGDLRLPSGDSYMITKRAVQQLAGAVCPVGSYGPSYLSSVDPDTRAYALNKHFKNPKSTKGLKLRTRLDNGVRTIFAVVSAAFPAFDTNHLLDTIRNIVPREARGVLKYSGDGGKMVFDVMYHSDIRPEDAVAGEIFKVGLRVSTADDSSGSYRVSILAYRNLCLNFIIIGRDEITLVRVIHRGDAVKIQQTLAAKVSEGTLRLDTFAKKWSAARQDVLPVEYQDQITHVYEKLLQAKVIRVPGKVEEVSKNLATSWLAEPGVTRADLVNGVTRYARDSNWSPSQWTDTSDVETSAGDFLYAQVRWSKLLS